MDLKEEDLKKLPEKDQEEAERMLRSFEVHVDEILKEKKEKEGRENG